MVETFISGLAGYLNGSLSLSFLAVYLAGVLVSFTPCMYPVVPITLAYIGARGSGSKTRGFVLSLIYVAGVAVTYTILGATAALSGKLFGLIQSNPLTYLFIGNLCIIMGLSMLGVFSFSLRTSDFIARRQNVKNPGGPISSFLVGAASGLVMGPCTGPGRRAGLCGDQTECAAGGRVVVRLRAGHGNIADSGRHLCRTAGGNPQIRRMDGPAQQGLRLDSAGNGRVFSGQCRYALVVVSQGSPALQY